MVQQLKIFRIIFATAFIMQVIFLIIKTITYDIQTIFTDLDFLSFNQLIIPIVSLIILGLTTFFYKYKISKLALNFDKIEDLNSLKKFFIIRLGVFSGIFFFNINLFSEFNNPMFLITSILVLLLFLLTFPGNNFLKNK